MVDSPVLHLDAEVSQENKVGGHGALGFVGITLLALVQGHLKLGKRGNKLQMQTNYTAVNGKHVCTCEFIHLRVHHI